MTKQITAHAAEALATIEALTSGQIHHARKAKATRLQEQLAAEYAALTIVPTIEGTEIPVTTWTAMHTSDEGEETTILATNDGSIPELADILEACEDADLDPEEGAIAKHSGSVVAETYRKLYRETSSNRQTCGDWLAEWLTDQCFDHSKGFLADAFAAVLDANAVDQTRPWAKLPESGQKGWIGRWRMNGRQALEKLVALHGTIYGPDGEEQQVPDTEIATLRAKHAKWIAKQEKLMEAEQQA